MNQSRLNIAFNKHFQQLLKDNEIHTQHVTVALSGGLDSVVLLHLLAQYQRLHSDIKLTAEHVDHGLSENAAHWAKFCAVYCQALQIPLTVSQVKLTKSSRTSLEALARDARYGVFKEKLEASQVIVTAHHQEDQLETLLLALKRGAGPTGLQGIRVCQVFAQGFLLRPLLEFSRQQLMEYATLHHLNWVEDESNVNTEFDRNYIRQKISPLLKQRWPSIQSAASRSAQLCQEQQTLIEEIAQQDLKDCKIERFSQQLLAIEPLALLSEVRRNNLLRFWIKLNNLSYPSQKQLQVLWREVAMAQPDKQPKLILGDYALRRYQGALYIVPEQKLTLPEHPVTWQGEDNLPLIENKLCIDFSQVDKGLAKKHKIDCRFRQHVGAQLTCLPEQRDKARSVKKLLHEYQVAPWLREQVVFVFCDGKLLQAVDVWQCSITGMPKLPLSIHFM